MWKNCTPYSSFNYLRVPFIFLCNYRRESKMLFSVFRLGGPGSASVVATRAGIGSGFVSFGSTAGTPTRFDLELLPMHWLPPLSCPFRWGVYEKGKSYLEVPPLYILDGSLLRKWLLQ